MVLNFRGKAPRGVNGAFVAVALAGAAFACGGPGTGRCPLEDWTGVCDLTSFTRVQDIEFPVPHSVYEAIYTPVKNAQSPNYTPPAVRLPVKALSKYEPLLEQHMQTYRQIACQQTIRDGCAYNPVVATLPEFDPNRYAQVQSTGPEGCAKVEGQESGSIGLRTSETFPERFQFVKDSADPDASMTATAQTIAQRLQADPGIECVGVAGQSAAGESPGVAELRAQAVKRLLIQAGVRSQRMMTTSSSTPAYGPGNEREPPKPEDQRVSITIILRTGAASGPPAAPAPTTAPAPAAAPTTAPAPPTGSSGTFPAQ
jgi:outer membrane protein OmpA-like peptidoglycan-associated protein